MTHSRRKQTLTTRLLALFMALMMVAPGGSFSPTSFYCSMRDAFSFEACGCGHADEEPREAGIANPDCCSIEEHGRVDLDAEPVATSNGRELPPPALVALAPHSFERPLDDHKRVESAWPRGPPLAPRVPIWKRDLALLI